MAKSPLGGGIASPPKIAPARSPGSLRVKATAPKPAAPPKPRASADLQSIGGRDGDGDGLKRGGRVAGRRRGCC